MEILHIYHTNDLHSHFEHWPTISSLLTERRKWHEQAGDEVLVFDIGDHMDRWHPFSDATRGKGNCRLLNEAGYDAVTIGNNEGITLSYEDLDIMYEKANFKVLAANLYRQDGKRPEWAIPSAMYITRTGTRIGVIGLTVFFEHFYELLGWKLTEPFNELKNVLKELRGKTDIIILLSHLGIHDDEAIARHFPEIDVILGGHTHHLLHEGKEIGNCLLAAAGKHGLFAGHITLAIDTGTKKLAGKKAILYDVNDLPAPMDEKEQIDRLYSAGKSLLEDSVINLPIALPADHFKDSRLTGLLCQGLKQWCDADCALVNAGLLLDGLPAGTVTHFDLLSICPHPINPCTVELTGAELKEVLLQSRDEKWPHMQIKGLGFRGTVMGKMIYDGIEFKRELPAAEGINIMGAPLDIEKRYKLAIPDMFTFGRFFPEIFRAKKKHYWFPEFLRDVLKWKILQEFGEG
ncbi:bifunctional metallophosphatase/5'-nucleotidase [Bacillus sp. T33-2]|uniref:bifunctional metallophosphatase/5'-nucleotidase n=1 Tax=Bacillus sp. T33-2 TaxID=2054168 RepID=UPI000C75A770|nr:bifunctional UDP-sugar hydrolase/5'-nucleotidase [Bacillus sp. T33-2]PLR92610.1 bifunctional metallophosphatase/5'-nucleotidase [Bacillus sp. T33-2]